MNTDPAAAASHRWMLRNMATPLRQRMTNAALTGQMAPDSHLSEPSAQSRPQNWSHLFTNGASRVQWASKSAGFRLRGGLGYPGRTIQHLWAGAASWRSTAVMMAACRR